MSETAADSFTALDDSGISRFQLKIMFGGRTAEEIIFGPENVTTGASNDIQVATDLARKMVCDWGMSEKLGPLHFGKPQGEVFLGRDFNDATKTYSEQTAISIDPLQPNGQHDWYTRAPTAEASRVAEFSQDTWLVDRDHCVLIRATTMPMTNRS